MNFYSAPKSYEKKGVEKKEKGNFYVILSVSFHIFLYISHYTCYRNMYDAIK